LRMRPDGCATVSVASPVTSGMTATPVSKPDKPSATFGNRITAIAAIIAGLLCCAKSVTRQFEMSSGCRAISSKARRRTTRFIIR
jgi:hypothetical protein